MKNQKLKISFITIKAIYHTMQNEKKKNHTSQILLKSSNQVSNKFSIPRKKGGGGMNCSIVR